MIKSQLIAKLADGRTHLAEKLVADSVNHILDTMRDALSHGERIEIRGFGSFSLHSRPPRQAHNPRTGERVITGEKKIPHFKAGKDLKDRVNASRAVVPLAVDED